MKLLFLSFIYLMTSGGSCDANDPFAYRDNTRVIIKGILIDENGAVLPLQSVNLMSQGSVIKHASSDEQGRLYISTPNANYAYKLDFLTKKILSVTQQPNNLEEINESQHISHLIRNNYCDFGYIKLINQN